MAIHLSTHRPFLRWLLVAACMAAAAPALAYGEGDVRIAVLPFTGGAPAQEMRSAVVKLLGERRDWTVVGVGRLETASTEGGVDIPALAEALNVDLVVMGTWGKDGAVVQVLSGRSGRLLGDQTYGRRQGKPFVDPSLIQVVADSLDGKEPHVAVGAAPAAPHKRIAVHHRRSRVSKALAAN